MLNFLKFYARTQADKAFINDMTYGQMYKRLLSQTAAFSQLKGKRLALLMENTIDHVQVLFSLLLLGKEVLLLNPKLTRAEIHDQIGPLGISEVKTLSELSHLEKKISPKNAASLLIWEPSDSKIAVLMNTSATSGTFKTVPITWGMIRNQVLASAQTIGVHSDDNWLITLPIFHVSGLSILMRTLFNGTSTSLLSHFDQTVFLDLVNSGRINMVSLVPTMLGRVIDRLERRRLRMILLGGEFIPQPLIIKALSRNLPVYKTYGMTETFSQSVTFNILDYPDKLDSVGLPLPGVKVHLLDSDQEGRGEIVLSSPMLMKGYLNQPPLDGTFRTGDIGYLDSDDFLYILNRRYDLIISGGENIYPKEIENLVYSLEGIWECALIGRSDDQWGQIPVLYYTGSIDGGTLLSYLNQHLAKYKLPKDIIQLASMPKTTSGKILRRDLKKLDESH